MTDELLGRHKAVLPDWLALYYADPLEITHGEGRHVWDAAGTKYLDFFGGILTTMTAHALPEVTKAVSEQAGRIIHSSTLYLNRPMVELAERIAQMSGIPDARVFFTTSGTEANDTALMLATTYRRSNQIMAMRNSYHGRSFSAVGITGNKGWSPTSLSPLQTLYVHGGVRTRGPYADLSDADFITACVADLEDLLGHGRPPAALIAEPIQGVGGFTSPPDGLYAAFREVLQRHGVLWISDEVQTGWGRTGDNFWGWQAHGQNGPPDILTFAKGIGNGMSIGGVVARSEVMNCLDSNSISTFGAIVSAIFGSARERSATASMSRPLFRVVSSSERASCAQFARSESHTLPVPACRCSAMPARVLCSATSPAAFTGPMPGTPGTLSLLSPTRARKSGICAGVTSNFSFTCAGPRKYSARSPCLGTS